MVLISIFRRGGGRWRREPLKPPRLASRQRQAHPHARCQPDQPDQERRDSLPCVIVPPNPDQADAYENRRIDHPDHEQGGLHRLGCLPMEQTGDGAAETLKPVLWDGNGLRRGRDDHRRRCRRGIGFGSRNGRRRVSERRNGLLQPSKRVLMVGDVDQGTVGTAGSDKSPHSAPIFSVAVGQNILVLDE